SVRVSLSASGQPAYRQPGLREHPLLSYRGIPSRPPVWTWIEGQEDKKPKGEIGTLTEVILSVIEPPNRCYLVIRHEGSAYMGCLFINDLRFCAQITLNCCKANAATRSRHR